MKKIGYILGVAVLVVTLTGCASWLVSPQKVVLLPEERIFTIPAGQKISVLLDKKPLDMTFPYDMKLVSPSVLVRQEQQLNDTMFKKIKAENRNQGILSFLTVIFSFVSGALALWFKNKVTTKK